MDDDSLPGPATAPPAPAAPPGPQHDARPPPAVAGIGASAGGLAAFSHFLQHMPADSGLAFVLVQRLDPQQHNLLPELLASHTAMPVVWATDQTLVAPNYVYLTPPNTALTIAQGALRLEPPTTAHGQLPIDDFFRSLAADGSAGLAAIQKHGGLTLAQTPASATSPGMPEQAIARGAAAHILEEVSVIVERHSDEVRLIIEDDGVGFGAPLPPGGPGALPPLGLLGMQERVALLNGTLTIESAPGSGTTIFAHIPLPGVQEARDGRHQCVSGR